MQNHISTTRKIQRTLTKYLKQTLGLKASSKAVKGVNGWLTVVNDVVVSKPVESVCKSLTGRCIPVLTLASK